MMLIGYLTKLSLVQDYFLQENNILKNSIFNKFGKYIVIYFVISPWRQVDYL